ncbi:MAG: hypothetical protein NW241_01150 [Bacteroidia bacterium]|nr:hypothetical protein [Bacteroidia bacterium]
MLWLLASLGSAWAGGGVSALMAANPHQGFDTGSTNPNHRYGFQGEACPERSRRESDNELYGDGNAIAFTYRVHDVRIGRFLSVDPLAPEYPWNSPYAFSENSTIAFIELEGLEKLYYNQDGKLSHQENFETVQYYVEDNNGQYCSQGRSYSRGLSYHSLFGDENKDAPEMYHSTVYVGEVLSEKTFRDVTSGGLLERSEQGGFNDAGRVLFWMNSGTNGAHDYKNKGILRSITEDQAIEVKFGNGETLLMNRHEVGMLYWGYAAAQVYIGLDTWTLYKALAQDNKAIHLTVEGNGDEWGEVYAWTFGFFLAKNNGRYYDGLRNHVEQALTWYFGTPDYKTQVSPYNADANKPVRDWKVNVQDALEVKFPQWYPRN